MIIIHVDRFMDLFSADKSKWQRPVYGSTEELGTYGKKLAVSRKGLEVVTMESNKFQQRAFSDRDLLIY